VPKESTTSQILDRLESHYGSQAPEFPTEPYDFLIWWHCGYPASDAACDRGWKALRDAVGILPGKILAATPAKLTTALKVGGLLPELRAERLKDIARRVKDEFGGDLRSGLNGPIARVRKLLRAFPGIAGPGIDRILLFGKISPVAAVPSNCPQVLVRILRGVEMDYGKTYREAQQLVAEGVSEKFEPRVRAYLLLKRHGQETCKRTNPKCEVCAVRGTCAYYARLRGTARA
jgi:endonuclease-3